MSLDTNITKWVTPSHQPITNRLNNTPALGIELEYERFEWEDIPEDEELSLEYWVAATDGSLRDNGVELVSRPLFFDEVENALTEAEAVVGAFGAESSTRCGLHIHMNMRPYSIGQVWSLACLYAIIEPALFQTYAKGREDSIYAVPLWMNTRQQEALFRDICHVRNENLEPQQPCHTVQNSKYASLNFSSLAYFGTLEMRQPYCTNDFEAIRSWIDFVKRLYMKGISSHNPDHIITQYEVYGLDQLHIEIFGEVIEVPDDIQELANDAAYDICGYAEPTWNELTWEDIVCAA